MAHVFENKGKGPFKCIRYYQHDDKGTGCDHCGTGIKHVFVIQTADGNEFNVGSSCVEKVGEKGLYDEAKQVKRLAIREAKRQAQEVKIKAMLDAQRVKNGGLTDSELMRQKEENELKIQSELLNPYANRLHDGKGGFCDSIADQMMRGIAPTGYALVLTLQILAKQAGRKGSKAYTAAHDELKLKFPA